jgi:short-subunit dehydrogenase
MNLTDQEAIGTIQKQLQDLGWSVDLLVNNAGLGRKYVFAEDPENDSSLDTVDIMVRAVVDMSLRFLPAMVKKGKGSILNVGSTGGYQPVPFTAMYSASKAFISTFSQAIREEQTQIESGVRIACVVPGITETILDGRGHGERRGTLDMVGIDQPETVAKVAVDALEDNAPGRIVGWNNKLLTAATSLLPSSTMANLVAASRGPPEQ